MRRKIYKYRHNLRAKHIFQSGFLQSTMATWKKVNKKINFRRTTRYFFFLLGFLSRALATHETAGEGREPFFIPLYHFDPLTNIQTFVYNFAREMTITYF